MTIAEHQGLAGGLVRPELGADERTSLVLRKRPDVFVATFLAWAATLAWFHPRMWSLTEVADGPIGFASIAYFVIFAEIAWLYGIYNVAIVSFAWVYRHSMARRYLSERFRQCDAAPADAPAVAVLYTTCNDFVERSAISCVNLAYANYHVYLLDDSTDPAAQARIDAFAARHLDLVTVVRRGDKSGFKAGNLNHALSKVAKEPLFAVVDADEILPANFLTKLVPLLLSDANYGFVQANHRCRPDADTKLARDMGVGVDIHWQWYQPLRNEYGFVMFLGHGALLRRSCWEKVGGFPEIVSEDLAYAIAIREQGYRGLFAEDVVCFEEFPETVRAFRVRHVKWTRGTCEFLWHWMGPLLRAKNITKAEKLDILFPTLNLPMTFFFFLFMINAQFLFPFVLGSFRDMTLVVLGQEIIVPVLALRGEISRIFGLDFFAITLLTIVAPVLCFVFALHRQPLRLFRFLTHSTALYAALSPLSFASVVGYALTRKARFLVTGDVAAGRTLESARAGPLTRLKRFFTDTHPDSPAMRRFEIGMGAVFVITALVSVQISFIGVALAFMLLPLMHTIGWDNRLVKRLVWAPFAIILFGISLGGLGVAGLQPVFFGFGFHF